VWGNETVLLVDDDERIRQLASFMLETAGYKVFSASGGEEALRLLAEGSIRPALLITDVDMPKMSGRQLARAVSTKVADMAVLFISGGAEHGESPLVVSGEHDSFLQKPFSAARLLRKVRTILDQPDVRRLR
jgi:DNA-binding response OmpR family regulator